MELKSFNKENMSQGRFGQSSISINRSGIINLSKEAVSAIGLKIGDKISLEQDSDNPQDWFIMKNNETGFSLRQYKGNNGLCFNSALLANTFFDEMNYDDTHSAAFKVIKEPNTEIEGVTLYPIIATKPIRQRVYGQEDEEENIDEEPEHQTDNRQY